MDAIRNPYTLEAGAKPPAGEVILAVVHAVQFGLALDQITETWAPYLTMSEGIQACRPDLRSRGGHLSCCAA